MDYESLLYKYNFGDIDIHHLNIDDYKNDYGNCIEQLLKNIKDYDYDTYKHSVRVGLLSLDIANQIGCDKDIQTEVYFGGLVHDIGKIFIPKNILNKPSKLTSEEFNIIKTHTILGAGYTFDILPHSILRIIRDHHEKLDGSGYLRQIDKQDINMQTRIVSIADMIDGYSSARTYHAEKSHAETMKFISEQDGLDNLIVKELLGSTTFHFKVLQNNEKMKGA